MVNVVVKIIYRLLSNVLIREFISVFVFALFIELLYENINSHVIWLILDLEMIYWQRWQKHESWIHFHTLYLQCKSGFCHIV